MNSIHSVKQKFKTKLINIYPLDEILSIWKIWVVKEILKITVIDSIINENNIINETDNKKINSLINHLLLNQPVQYFFGYSYFKNLKLLVNNNVLIPRPETEQLIDFVIDESSQLCPNTILDIGTGSGCIAIALKKYIKSNIIAIDISENALSIASENALNHNIDIKLKVIDIINIDNHKILPKVDYIVSNPPYVTKNEVSNKSIVYAEPEHAIFVPNHNPLIFYEYILKFANTNLNEGGKIFFEINPKFLSQLLIIIKKYGYSNIKILDDLFGKKRFIIVYSV